MSESKRIREHLHGLLVELSRMEMGLERDTEVLSKLLARGNSKQEDNFDDDGFKLHNMATDLVSDTLEEVPRDRIIHPESRSKLAIQTEQEIIAAIEKCKLTAQEAKFDKSKQMAEDFDYRPEGMFPPVPKPISKQEKLEHLNKAYGPASKQSKAQPIRETSNKPRTGSQRRYDPQFEANELASGKKAWNQGALGKPTNGGSKLPPKPKPSESQYTNLKTVDPNRHLKKNPEKITSSSRGLSSGPKGRTSSRGPVSKVSTASTTDHLESFSSKGSHAASQLTSAQETPTPISPPKQVYHLEPIPKPIPRMAALPNPVKPSASPTQTSNPLSKALSIFKSMHAHNSPNKEGALGASETRLLQLIQRAKDRARNVFAEYMTVKAAEAKRQAIEAAAHKMMFRTALQTAYWEEWMHEALGKQDIGDDQHMSHEGTDYLLPKLTKALVRVQDIDAEQLRQAIDLVYCGSPEWEQFSENEELDKLHRFRREGIMDKESESYLDMINLLKSAKGLKSHQGQDLLGQMYSIWYFSDQFVDRYNQLKLLKGELDQVKSGLVEKVMSREVKKALDKILPPASQATSTHGSHEDELEVTLSSASPQDTQKFVTTSLNSYLELVKSHHLPGLKAQLQSLRNSKDGWETPKYQRDLGAFLMQLQSVDKLMKLNSTLPLIFHQNMAPEQD